MQTEYTFHSKDSEITINYEKLRQKYIYYTFILSTIDVPDEELDSINSEVKKLVEEYKMLNGIK